MIENITEYTLELLKQFIKYSIKRNRIVTFISSAVILLCALLMFLMNDILFGAFFTVLGVIFLILAFFLMPISMRRATKMPNIINAYQFLPDHMIITTFSNGKNLGTSKISYTAITKIVENKNHMYLYLNRLQALVVDANLFKESTDKEVLKAYIKNTQEFAQRYKNKTAV